MKSRRQFRSVYIINNKSVEQVSKEANYEWLKTISQFITLIIPLHYFLSFKWLYNYLKPYNLDLSSIISVEDLQFNFSIHNWVIIFPSLLGLVFIIAIKLIIPNKIYENLGEKTKEEVKKKWIEILDFCKDTLNAKLFFSYLILVSLGGIYYFSQLKNEIDINISLICILTFLWVIIPFLYLFLSGKREVISLIYVLFVFLWANTAINDIFIKSTKDKTVYKVVFEFKDKRVKSTSTYQFIYKGSKGIVMLDVLNDSTIHIFPSKYIGEFSFNETNVNKEGITFK